MKDGIKTTNQQRGVMKQLTIIELIGLLETCNKNADLRFDFCNFAPGYFHSYRGYYSDLAIAPEKGAAKVGDFLQKLKQQVGRVHDGWKGGEFMMKEDTVIWVAEVGSTSNTVIVGIKSNDNSDRIIIETADIDD